MAKTRISMNETNDICRYFIYLKCKYKIKNSQLYNNCEHDLSEKTIAKYMSGKPNNSISYATLNTLVDSFSKTLKAQGVSCPPELSTEFLISSQLHPFLENLSLEIDPASIVIDTPCNVIDSQTVAIDPNTVDQESENECHVITCDPFHNNRFIAFLFGLGGSIILCTSIWLFLRSIWKSCHSSV